MDRLHAKEENCKNLQLEIEDQHQKVGVIRHQMGLLYEEFHKEKEGWKINRSEYDNTIRFEAKITENQQCYLSAIRKKLKLCQSKLELIKVRFHNEHKGLFDYVKPGK